MNENNPKETRIFTTQLDIDLYTKLNERANKEYRSKQSIIRQLISNM